MRRKEKDAEDPATENITSNHFEVMFVSKRGRSNKVYTVSPDAKEIIDLITEEMNIEAGILFTFF